MKNIFKTIIFAFCLIALGSCEDDPDPVVSANGFSLSSSDAPTSNLTLVPQNDANVVATVKWGNVDNGTGSDVSQYNVEAAQSGTNFANPIILNSGNVIPTENSYAISVKELNMVANNQAGYECGKQMSIDVRVKSTLGKGYYNEFVQYSSNVLTINIMPYSTLLPVMSFSATAPSATTVGNLAASSVLTSDYEGYMWLVPGNYKFYKANGCGTFDNQTVYGDAAGYNVTVAGFYLVKANLTTPDYSFRAISWNFFGPAKPTFPGANTALTYDQATGLWKTTAPVNLGNGYEIQFRSNGVTTSALVLGGYDASKTGDKYAGTAMSYDGVQLIVPGTRSPRVNTGFMLTLDLTSPRNYKYTITPAP